MSHNQFSLLKTKRFFPLFVTQFMGAFNDNVFKNALVFLVTYKLVGEAGMPTSTFVALAAALFIFPFFIFSAIAGQLADKLEKSRLVQIIKFCEILLMALASYGFYTSQVPVLLVTLFLMGTQSTFFGPLKYSLLPAQLEDDELVGGNALIESGTFLAILLGTIIGGVLILTDGGVHYIMGLVLINAVFGFLASLKIPRSYPLADDVKINYNIFTETVHIVGVAKSQKTVFLSIMGISWFWFFGATFITQFAPFSRDIMQANADVGILFLCCFSVGIALGSLLCNKLLKGRIHATYVPLAGIVMTIFSLDLYFAISGAVKGGESLLTLMEFVRHGANIRILFDLVMIAVGAGLYIVPLYALVQENSRPSEVSRMIAANNILNALFMVVSALGTIVMFQLGYTIPDVFLTVAILNAVVVIYICRLLPEELVKSITRSIFRLLYRVEVKGMEHYSSAGEKAVIVANHTSFIDGALLGAFLPDRLTFAINTFIAEKWWVKPAFAFLHLLPLDPTSPMSAKTMISEVKKKRRLVIFPEGRITVTGALMKIYEGPGIIAFHSDAPILPIRIEGAQYTPFSKLKGKLRLRWFPKIIIHILEPVKIDLPEKVTAQKRRNLIGQQLYNVMSKMIFDTSDMNKTLFQSLIDARVIHGNKHVALEDAARSPLDFKKLMLGSFVLGKRISKFTQDKEKVGFLLPNSAGSVLVFFAIQAYGRIPAMLNFSAGARNIIVACTAAGVNHVLTSKQFIEKAKLEEVIKELSEHVNIIYLEDLKKSISTFDKIYGTIANYFPKFFYELGSNEVTGTEESVVLFTSGSEGVPKGVSLSHKNIQANRYQLSSIVDFGPQDVVFNAMPIFHCFGLTGGLLLPLLAGIKVFLYPSPLHYKIVPELVYDCNATIMFGTDTFLTGYARFAHAYDFYSVRYIFAGAERLKPETRTFWAENFGVRIFEGYGATETAPILACNTPMHTKIGSVGRLVPGLEHRLEPVEGIEKGGRLIVKGPNVMRGYLTYEEPEVLKPPLDGWYDTGDIVEIDDEGFVTIKGRAKRFAKIAGEMISFVALEVIVGNLYPENLHAVVAIPDDKKGEQLVLVTNSNVTREEISDKIKAEKLQALLLPKEIKKVMDVPILGTGKIDFPSVEKLVKDS